ncbi:hypothetical protein TI04_06655 [Achromatium sp. WMS2]|nr:hypothetical protein TI04_06655 [Achromatium sp. WMS2]
MSLQSQFQIQNAPSGPTWQRIGVLLTILSILVSVVIWRFQLGLIGPIQALQLCEYVLGPKPDCTAPILETETWKYCTENLATQTLDPIVFHTKMLHRTLLNLNPAIYGPPQPISSGATLHGGDKLQVSLDPPVAARIYLLHRDASGNFTAFLSDQHLKVGQQYLLPKGGIQLYNAETNDKFYVIVAADDVHPMLDYQIGVLKDATVGPAASKRLAALLDGPLVGHYLLFDYQTKLWLAPTAN